MCVRLFFALLLVASCGSCVSEGNRCCGVRPSRPCETATAKNIDPADRDIPHEKPGISYRVPRGFGRVRGHNLLYATDPTNKCPFACVYVFNGPKLSVSALKGHIDTFGCLVGTGCSIVPSGTSGMALELKGCECHTVVVEQLALSGQQTKEAWVELKKDVPYDFSIITCTDGTTKIEGSQ